MLDKYIQEYNEKGIVVIPDVFTKKEMARFKKEAYTLTPEVISKAGYKHKPFEYSNNHPALVFFPALANKYINEIRKDKRFVEIVKAFLGDNIKQVNNQIYFREAGDGDQFAWHQDIVFREPRNRFPGVETGYLQTYIAIDDITLENGAVEFIEGSHLEGEQNITSSRNVTKMLRTFKRGGLKGKKYTAKAGSVLLWSVLTVHGSESNISDSNRMTYMNGLCKADNCLDYPWFMRKGNVQDIEPHLIP